MTKSARNFMESYQDDAWGIYLLITEKIGRFSILWELSKKQKTRTTTEKIIGESVPSNGLPSNLRRLYESAGESRPALL